MAGILGLSIESGHLEGANLPKQFSGKESGVKQLMDFLGNRPAIERILFHFHEYGVLEKQDQYFLARWRTNALLLRQASTLEAATNLLKKCATTAYLAGTLWYTDPEASAVYRVDKFSETNKARLLSSPLGAAESILDYALNFGISGIGMNAIRWENQSFGLTSAYTGFVLTGEIGETTEGDAKAITWTINTGGELYHWKAVYSSTKWYAHAANTNGLRLPSQIKLYWLQEDKQLLAREITILDMQLADMRLNTNAFWYTTSLPVKEEAVIHIREDGAYRNGKRIADNSFAGAVVSSQSNNWTFMAIALFLSIVLSCALYRKGVWNVKQTTNKN